MRLEYLGLYNNMDKSQKYIYNLEQQNKNKYVLLFKLCPLTSSAEESVWADTYRALQTLVKINSGDIRIALSYPLLQLGLQTAHLHRTL